RKSMPTPYWPAAGSLILRLLHSCSRNACGICTRMPAPSPVFGSHPQAPRCSRFSRIWMALSTMSCDFRPVRLATKPTPHESCSKLGSYKPCLDGLSERIIGALLCEVGQASCLPVRRQAGCLPDIPHFDFDLRAFPFA